MATVGVLAVPPSGGSHVLRGPHDSAGRARVSAVQSAAQGGRKVRRLPSWRPPAWHRRGSHSTCRAGRVPPFGAPFGGGAPPRGASPVGGSPLRAASPAGGSAAVTPRAHHHPPGALGKRKDTPTGSVGGDRRAAAPPPSRVPRRVASGLDMSSSSLNGGGGVDVDVDDAVNALQAAAADAAVAGDLPPVPAPPRATVAPPTPAAVRSLPPGRAVGSPLPLAWAAAARKGGVDVGAAALAATLAPRVATALGDGWTVAAAGNGYVNFGRDGRTRPAVAPTPSRAAVAAAAASALARRARLPPPLPRPTPAARAHCASSRWPCPRQRRRWSRMSTRCMPRTRRGTMGSRQQTRLSPRFGGFWSTHRWRRVAGRERRRGAMAHFTNSTGSMVRERRCGGGRKRVFLDLQDSHPFSLNPPPDKLAAVGVVDVLPGGLSSVYCFWDPDLAPCPWAASWRCARLGLWQRSARPPARPPSRPPSPRQTRRPHPHPPSPATTTWGTTSRPAPR